MLKTLHQDCPVSIQTIIIIKFIVDTKIQDYTF